MAPSPIIFPNALILLLAVITPIESTFFTSLYVNSPPTVIFPATSNAAAVTIPVNIAEPLL